MRIWPLFFFIQVKHNAAHTHTTNAWRQKAEGRHNFGQVRQLRLSNSKKPNHMPLALNIIVAAVVDHWSGCHWISAGQQLKLKWLIGSRQMCNSSNYSQWQKTVSNCFLTWCSNVTLFCQQEWMTLHCDHIQQHSSSPSHSPDWHIKGCLLQSVLVSHAELWFPFSHVSCWILNDCKCIYYYLIDLI